MLTDEQLAEFIQQGGNDDLKPVLWERVRRLMYMRSSRYFRRYTDYCTEHGVTELDLRQQAYQAYENALKKFESGRGKFSTILSYTFKNSIRGLFKRDTLNRADSLDRIIDNGSGDSDTVLIDLIADDTSAVPFEIIEEKSQREETARVLRKCIDRLEEREKGVIDSYFYNGETLGSIGRAYGITKSRVQIIRDRALRNMYEMPEIRKLGDEYGYTSRAVYHDGLTGFRQSGQCAAERVAIARADIELQAAKAITWTSDEKFLEMLKAARERRAEAD